MIIRIVLMTIAVAGCLIFGAATFFSINEILINTENVTSRSFLCIFTIISAFLFLVFGALGWWVCYQFLSLQETKND